MAQRSGRGLGAIVGVAALLALAGCATQGGSSAGDVGKTVTPVATTPPAAAAPAAQGSAASATAHAAGSAHPALAPPTESELQAGIQVAHVGVTAAGGLIDARFRVLDPAKAGALLANPANAPMLISGDKPPLMAPHHAIKGSHFNKDQMLLILYPNTRGAVQPGTPVTVALGALRIGPVTAQ